MITPGEWAALPLATVADLDVVDEVVVRLDNDGATRLARARLDTLMASSPASSQYQPLDSDLTAIAALSTTAYGRGLLTAASQSALATLIAADAALTARFSIGPGYPHNLPISAISSTIWPTINDARYSLNRVTGTISKIAMHVTASSGNISVAAYTNSGSGTSATPTGGRLATSGAVACPALGYVEVSLGASVTLNAGDWFGVSSDNATFAAHGINGLSSALLAGMSYSQSTAHPCPSVPTVSTGTASIFRVPYLIGVA